MIKNKQTLLFNAQIWGQPDLQNKIGWMLIVDNKIADIGTGTKPIIDDAIEIDLNGKHITPGFVDCHTHISVSAWFPYTLDCSSWDTKDKLLNEISKKSEAVSSDSWVIGFFADFHKIQTLPDKHELDIAANGRPVLIVENALHQSVASSSALKAANVTKIKFPTGYVIKKRGDATGHLKEMAHAHVLDIALTQFSEQFHELNIQSLLESELDRHLSLGITMCHDPCVHPKLQSIMERLSEKHPIKLSWSHIHSEENIGLVSENICLSCGQGPRSAKIFLDGGLDCSVCLSPIEAFRMSSYTMLDALKGDTDGLMSLFKSKMRYRDGKLRSDFLKKSPVELTKTLDQVVSGGRRPKIHALGNEAVACACKAIKESGTKDATIEHLSIMGDSEIDLVANVGAVASLQPGFLISSTSLADCHTDKAMKVIPAKSLLKSGVDVALSSDNPCGPLNPLENIQSAITRKAYNGRVINPNEALTISEAMNGYSTGGYLAIHGKYGGGLAKGENADLCILSGSPDHSQTRVLSTWINGKEVWPSKRKL